LNSKPGIFVVVWPRRCLIAVAVCVPLFFGCGSDGSAPSDGTVASADDLSGCSIPKPTGASCNPFCSDCGYGSHCAVVGEALKCTETGVRLDGDACTSVDQCASGLSCFGIGDDNPVCRRLCNSSSPCRSGDACTESVTIEGGLTLQYCGEPPSSCSLRHDGCELGQTCLLGSDGAVCGVAGVLPVGAPCRAFGSGACLEGLQCVIVCSVLCALEGSEESDMPLCVDDCSEWAVVDPEQQVGICTDANPAGECQVLQGDCGVSEACYPFSVGWACAPQGNIPEKGACTKSPECSAGHVCAQNTCRKFCARDDSGPTGCEMRCSGSYSVLAPSSWGLGVCDP
jgi:hypothetical protein